MKKLSAAAELGRKGGLKGGPARASRLTAAQRTASAKKAVQARWARAANVAIPSLPASPSPEASDAELISLLARLRETTDLEEVRQLTGQIERVIFHNQFANA